MTFSLSVSVSGPGSVTSDPRGIACPGSTCSADFDSGTSVTLTATPDRDAYLYAWGGACEGKDTECTVTMDDVVTVDASFRYTVD